MTPKERYDATAKGMRRLREQQLDTAITRFINEALEQAELSGIHLPHPPSVDADITVRELSGLLYTIGRTLKIGWDVAPQTKPLPPYREPYYVEGGPTLAPWVGRDWGILQYPHGEVIAYPGGGIKQRYERTDRKWTGSDGIERTIFTWVGECDD